MKSNKMCKRIKCIFEDLIENKNNLFMFSFILFLILIVPIKYIFGFEDLDLLVASVAVASMFFSVSDMFATMIFLNQEKDRVYYEDLKEMIKTEESCKLQVEEKKHAMSESLGDDAEVPALFSKIEATLDKVIESESAMVVEIEENRMKKYCYEVSVCVLTILGFLSFFFSVFIDIFSMYIVRAQSMISIVTFTLILITQYVKNIRVREYESVAHVIEDGHRVRKELLAALRNMDITLDK